jgi:micrococcal nuclease
MTEYLDTITYKDTIPYIPNIKFGKVIKVYDGDTITIACKMPHDNSPIYRFSVRIAGIDCPEMKTNNKTEKECAIIAKTTVSELVLHEIVQLQNVKLEKYGRILADVFTNGISLGDMLCECNMAVKYDGGTKVSPNDWMDYYNSSKTSIDKYLRNYVYLNTKEENKKNSFIHKFVNHITKLVSTCLFRKTKSSNA